MMRLYKLLLIIFLIGNVAAGSECDALQSEYEKALSSYEISVRNNENARNRYPLVNTTMDKTVALLAYCHESLSLSQQHTLRSQLRKLDRHRSSLALSVIDEYRRLYGIKPETQVIYLDQRDENGRYGDKKREPKSGPLPPVMQPALPPIIQPVMPPVKP